MYVASVMNFMQCVHMYKCLWSCIKFKLSISALLSINPVQHFRIPRIASGNVACAMCLDAQLSRGLQ